MSSCFIMFDLASIEMVHVFVIVYLLLNNDALPPDSRKKISYHKKNSRRFVCS